MATYDPSNKVKVVNDSPVGAHAKLMIGDSIIPVTGIDIRIRPDELTTIEATITADEIDVEALQQETEITITRSENEENNG